MAKRVTSYAALLANQKQRFATLGLSQKDAVRDIARETFRDLKEQTAGSLRPSQTRGAFARGAAPGLGGARRRGPRRRISPLPVNRQSGRLNAAANIRGVAGNSFTVGFSSRAGGAIYRIIPGGTSKLVDSGLYGPNGYIAKRVAARRKAFRDQYLRKARTA